MWEKQSQKFKQLSCHEHEQHVIRLLLTKLYFFYFLLLYGTFEILFYSFFCTIIPIEFYIHNFLFFYSSRKKGHTKKNEGKKKNFSEEEKKIELENSIHIRIGIENWISRTTFLYMYIVYTVIIVRLTVIGIWMGW